MSSLFAWAHSEPLTFHEQEIYRADSGSVGAYLPISRSASQTKSPRRCACEEPHSISELPEHVSFSRYRDHQFP
jgi:hypothetical protein